MQPGIRNTLIGCVVFMALMLGLFLNNALRTPELTNEQLREHGIVVLPTPREVAPFELVDEDGEPFRREDLAGRWTLAYFGFTHCPDICPVTMSVLGQVHGALEEEGVADPFRGLLVSVDPERDTPEVLDEYVAFFDPDFGGVTGPKDEIARLASQVSVAFAAVPRPDAEDGYTVDHSGNIVLFNPRGHYAGFIRMPHSAEQIELAFRTLQARTR